MRNDERGKAILLTGVARGIGTLSGRATALAGRTVYAGLRRASARNRAAPADLTRHKTDHRFDVHAVDLHITSRDDAKMLGTQQRQSRHPAEAVSAGCLRRIAPDSLLVAGRSL